MKEIHELPRTKGGVFRLALMPHDQDSLRARCQPVEEITRAHRKLANMMIDQMRCSRGIGLAAPQVHHPLRMIVYELRRGDPKVIYNPEILQASAEQIRSEEGCLSLPGERFVVPRAERVEVRALDRKGKPVLFRATGTFAIVLQHEIDHLDGILVSDKALERKKVPAGA